MYNNTQPPVISLQNVCVKYHSDGSETEALRNVSFDIEPREFVSLVGSSGCGKSTILSAIAGLVKPSGGQVLYKGAAVSKINGKEIGYMLQHDHLFPWATVLSNVCIGLKVAGQNTAANRKRMLNMLNQYGLGDFAHRYPRELSGGMRQRAALLRTLALEPEMLLLDESFSALDYQTRIRVSGDIASIIKNTGKTALLVTHDISEAISLSDRVIVLSKRPAVVKSIIDINWPDEVSGNERRRSPMFAHYFDLIWEELNDEN